MRFVLLDRTQTVLAYCDAQTKLGAVAKLKPKEGETVTSEASFRIGFPASVTKAMREAHYFCTVCRQKIRPGEERKGESRHERCARMVELQRRWRAG